jgi:hypothetical protein
MAIGRTEDRNTPGNPLGVNPAVMFGAPIRVTHLGPRSTRPHTEAGHMTAIDQTRPSCKKALARRGPSTHWFRVPASDDAPAEAALSSSAWDRLQDALIAANFWTLDPVDEQRGLDGANWLIEGGSICGRPAPGKGKLQDRCCA